MNRIGNQSISGDTHGLLIKLESILRFSKSFLSLSPQRELLDLSTVDVILISNYHCMMALPYITEHTGFTGTVYATEPTLQIGRCRDARPQNIDFI